MPTQYDVDVDVDVDLSFQGLSFRDYPNPGSFDLR